MLTKVILHGELADIACPEYTGHIRTTRDAVRLLEVNYPQFKSYLINAHNDGVVFKVKCLNPDIEHLENCWELDETELFDPTQGREIHIFPIPMGAGNIGKIILGVALIGLAISGVGLLGLSPLMTGVMGGLLLLSGVMGSPTEAPNPDDEDTKSFIFSGAVNTVSTGARVPVAYGYSLVTGSYVISANIRTFSIR